MKVTGLAQKLGQLGAVHRELQSKYWANLKLLGQPCNFYAQADVARLEGRLDELQATMRDVLQALGGGLRIPGRTAAPPDAPREGAGALDVPEPAVAAPAVLPTVLKAEAQLTSPVQPGRAVDRALPDSRAAAQAAAAGVAQADPAPQPPSRSPRVAAPTGSI